MSRRRAAQVDILLNNAGLALGTAPVQATTTDDALGMITTNVSAVVRAPRFSLVPFLSSLNVACLSLQTKEHMQRQCLPTLQIDP